MRCPFCGHGSTSVKDSRAAEDNATIRRRRHCDECNGRFTTVEHVQLLNLRVIKKSAEVEPFKRDKLLNSLKRALHRRPVDEDKIEKITNSIIRQLETRGEVDIQSPVIGKMVMDVLRELDEVAYIRFASIYRNFEEVQDFSKFIKEMPAGKDIP